MKTKPQAYLRFAFFHQSEGLLHQFFLNECLLIFQTLQEKSHDKLGFRLMGEAEKGSLWSSTPGHLPKLHLYYSLLITHFADPQTLILKKIGSILTRACTKVRLSSDKPSMLQGLKQDIRAITILFFEKLSDYEGNESILFFLLRSHEQFDALHGKPIIAKLFAKLFRGGIEEAGTFLEEHYEQNGFNHLLPLISEKIDSLKGAL